MQQNERDQFEKHCRDIFGFSSKHIHYKLTDLESRISKIEQNNEASTNILTATILRLEGLIKVLMKGYDYPRQLLDKIEEESENLFKENKNKLIEKK